MVRRQLEGSASNRATTSRFPSTTTLAGEEDPDKSPDQPEKRYPEAGTAVSWTALPRAYFFRSGDFTTDPECFAET